MEVPPTSVLGVDVGRVLAAEDTDQGISMLTEQWRSTPYMPGAVDVLARLNADGPFAGRIHLVFETCRRLRYLARPGREHSVSLIDELRTALSSVTYEIDLISTPEVSQSQPTTCPSHPGLPQLGSNPRNNRRSKRTAIG